MTRRTVHLLAGLHITATDKRHILALVDKGWQRGSTRRKSYEITERRGNTLRLTSRAGKATTWADRSRAIPA